MAFARENRRVEEHQCVKAAPILERVQSGGYTGERMKDARDPLLAQLTLDRLKHHFHIENEAWPFMRIIPMKRVVTMVAKIKHHDFVALAKRSPEWEIPVDREAVAVAEHQARTVWFPVL